jgi:protein O-mannosyl-transferase
MSPRTQARDDVVATSNTTPSLIDVIVLVVVVTIIYLNSLSGVFLFDDLAGIVNNATIRDIGSFEWLQPRARPVTTFSFAINYAIGGLDPIGYHIVNIAIHAVNAVLLYGLVQAILIAQSSHGSAGLSARQFAFTAAIFWAVHPLCTASVTYVIQRGESLAALGMLATLWCWMRATDSSIDTSTARRWFLAAVGSAFIAYGSKETSAFLPIVLLMFDRIFCADRWLAIKSRLGWHCVIALPVLIGIGILAQELTQGNSRQTVGFTMDRIDSLSYFASQPVVFAHYLRLSFIPLWQTLDYGWLPSNRPLAIGVGIAAWCVMISATAWLLFRRPQIGFLLAASLLVLAPSSSFVPLQDIVFEHRMYLPLAALCILVCQGMANLIERASQRFERSARKWVAIGGTCILLILCVLTVARNQDYQSRERMFALDVKHCPDNPRAWANLADEVEFENVDDKIAMCVKAYQLYEQRGYFYAGVKYKLGRGIADLYFLTGRPNEAKSYYAQAIEAANDATQAAEIHMALAMIESGQGNAAAADQHFESAIAQAESLPGLHETFAVHLRRTGRESAAVTQEQLAKQK